MSNMIDSTIPVKAGIGLRSPHYREVIDSKPEIAWLEVHSENFFAEGGIALHILEQIRNNYPLSLHGVGLSLGTCDKLDETHLQKLKKLVDRFEPGLVSEHISWSAVNGKYLNDLLPLPYTSEALDRLVLNIQQLQDYLGRQILIENPSTYLEFTESEMAEYEFINLTVQKSGCGLLLDINNIHVCASNHGFDANEYIEKIAKDSVKEIHLAGFEPKQVGNETILIDTHSAQVYPEVWQLYEKAVKHFGNIPTLIEWDAKIPELDVLLAEAQKAQTIMDSNGGQNAAA